MRSFPNKFVVFIVWMASCWACSALAAIEPHGGMMRYPDVSATHIVFVYADDIWIAPRSGGMASPLASPPGGESFPRFSADGLTIAFNGNYDGPSTSDAPSRPDPAGGGGGFWRRDHRIRILSVVLAFSGDAVSDRGVR